MTAYAAADFARDAVVSRETLARFETWRGLLEKWQARINLVGPDTLADFWLRHALDSVQVLDAAPIESRLWADLGSGAGFPGLAAALAAQDRGRGVEIHLIESNQKKAAFLREAVRATGAPAVVRAARIEEIAGETFDVVTARAFAPLTRLFECADSLWKEDTVGVFLKGKEVEAELANAAESWRFRFDLRPSRSAGDGRVARIEGLARHDRDAARAR